jgi:rhomboid protease GluP
VSIGIIVICVAFLIFDRALPGVVALRGGGFLQAGALYGPLVAQGQYYRLLLMAFEHGGVLHLAMNMSVVWTLGRPLERAVGSLRFAIVSLITALGASAVTLLLAFQSPTVGASGMILGWAGVMFVLATPEGRRGLGTWLVQIAVISLLPHVSWQGHLGGFLAGLPCGWSLRGGPRRFRLVAPVLLLAVVGLAWVASSGVLPRG